MKLLVILFLIKLYARKNILIIKVMYDYKNSPDNKKLDLNLTFLGAEIIWKILKLLVYLLPVIIATVV